MKITHCTPSRKHQLRLVKYFMLEVIARSAADLCSIQPNSTALFYRKLLRILLTKQAQNAHEVSITRHCLPLVRMILMAIRISGIRPAGVEKAQRNPKNYSRCSQEVGCYLGLIYTTPQTNYSASSSWFFTIRTPGNAHAERSAS